MKKYSIKIIIIISGIAVIMAGTLFSIKSFILRGACITPAGLEQFVYNDSKFSAQPLFKLEMNLPVELISNNIREDKKIGWSRGGSSGLQSYWDDTKLFFFNYAEYPYERYFTINLGRFSHYHTTLDYINSNIKSAENAFPNPNVSMPSNQTSIAKVAKPEELAQRGMGSPQCIKEFWKYVDEIYLVEPKTDQARDYFDLQGVAHSVTSEDDDPIESPFGLYAAKYIDNVPLILHFVWANRDEDVFFKDKPYSVFDVLWSIRFDVLQRI